MRKYQQFWTLAPGQMPRCQGDDFLGYLIVEAEAVPPSGDPLSLLILMGALHKAKVLVLCLPTQAQLGDDTLHSFASDLAERLDQADTFIMKLYRKMGASGITGWPFEWLVLWHPENLAQAPCPEVLDQSYIEVLQTRLYEQSSDAFGPDGKAFQPS
jgi:hypothetical protein